MPLGRNLTQVHFIVSDLYCHNHNNYFNHTNSADIFIIITARINEDQLERHLEGRGESMVYLKSIDLEYQIVILLYSIVLKISYKLVYKSSSATSQRLVTCGPFVIPPTTTARLSSANLVTSGWDLPTVILPTHTHWLEG